MSSSSSSTTWSPTRKSYQSRNHSWNSAKYNNTIGNNNTGNNDSDNIAKREFQDIIDMLSEGSKFFYQFYL